MTDRTPGSVRTGSRTGPTPDPQANGAGGQVPVSATQAIPTGTQRAQSADGPAKDAGSPKDAGRAPVGSAAGSASSAPPAGSAAVTGTAATRAAGAGESGRADAGTSSAGKPPAAKGRGTSKAGGRGPRRARLQLRHIDTWSALKISLVLSIALFFIWMVAVGVLYGVLSGLGVFDTLNDLFGQLSSASGSDGGGEFITAGVVFGGAAIIGAVNIVLMTALCTVGTFIYNLCSDLVGGLELTLSERD